jgi:hypothetical protein
MYCPNCGSQSTGNLKYCRSCGTDLGVVSQALTGQLAPAAPSRPGRKHGQKDVEPPQIDSAVRTAFVGVAFFFVSLAVLFFAPAGRIWWFWLLIPAFISLGKGIGEYFKWKELQGNATRTPAGQEYQPPPPQYLSPPPETGRFDTPNSFEKAPPPSVTEDTTRHLDAHVREPER